MSETAAAWHQPGRFLTQKQVEEELAVSGSQVYPLIRNRQLRAIRIGGRGQYRVARADLEAYIERAYVETEAYLTDNPLVRPTPTAPTPTAPTPTAPTPTAPTPPAPTPPAPTPPAPTPPAPTPPAPSALVPTDLRRASPRVRRTGCPVRVGVGGRGLACSPAATAAAPRRTGTTCSVWASAGRGTGEPWGGGVSGPGCRWCGRPVGRVLRLRRHSVPGQRWSRDEPPLGCCDVCAGLLGWTPYDAVVDGAHAQADALDAVRLLTGADPLNPVRLRVLPGRGCLWCGRGSQRGWCPTCAVLLEHAAVLAGQLPCTGATPAQLQHAAAAVGTAEPAAER